jgi:bile acid:Na+ symporter, BASS family
VDLVNLFYTQIIPYGLWIAMLGMGLSLSVGDFKRVLVEPKAMSVGLAGQLIGLPLLAFVLGMTVAPTPAIAVGAIILAACPGGITSNTYSFATRADVALSVSLTAVSSFVTVFTLPVITYTAMSYFLESGSAPDVPMLAMMITLATQTVLPIVIGMIIGKIWAKYTRPLIEIVRKAAFVFLLVLVVAGTIVAFDVLKQYFLQTMSVALTLNVVSMAMGFGLARLFSLPPAQSVTITYEVGVQNLSLSSLVVLSLLRNEEFFVVTLVYAAIMKITALSFMYFARRWLAGQATRAAAVAAA